VNEFLGCSVHFAPLAPLVHNLKKQLLKGLLHFGRGLGRIRVFSTSNVKKGGGELPLRIDEL